MVTKHRTVFKKGDQIFVNSSIENRQFSEVYIKDEIMYRVTKNGPVTCEKYDKKVLIGSFSVQFRSFVENAKIVCTMIYYRHH